MRARFVPTSELQLVNSQETPLLDQAQRMAATLAQEFVRQLATGGHVVGTPFPMGLPVRSQLAV
ncbi:MAG: hypothetical protein NVS4B8_00710 [Herpetosiphon sp.]